MSSLEEVVDAVGEEQSGEIENDYLVLILSLEGSIVVGGASVTG